MTEQIKQSTADFSTVEKNPDREKIKKSTKDAFSFLRRNRKNKEEQCWDKFFDGHSYFRASVTTTKWLLERITKATILTFSADSHCYITDRIWAFEKLKRILSIVHNQLSDILKEHDKYKTFWDKINYINKFYGDQMRKITNDDTLLDDEKNKKKLELYDKIIKDSLELLKKNLDMDLIALAIIEDPKQIHDWIDFTFQNVSWDTKNLSRDNLISEIIDAKIAFQEKWEILYSNPSDSDSWVVDSVFVISQISWEPMWYLLLDKFDDQVDIWNTDKAKLCEIFVRELKTVLSEQKVMQLNMMATIDKLTWLSNRQVVSKYFTNIFDKVNRHDYDVWVVSFDIDNFKSVNDQHGHEIWDKMLVSLANLLRQKKRNLDLPVRFWWEEFFVFCEWTDKNWLSIYANKLRELFSNMKVEYKRYEWTNEINEIVSRTLSIWCTMIYKEEVKLYFEIIKLLNKNNNSIFDKISLNINDTNNVISYNYDSKLILLELLNEFLSNINFNELIWDNINPDISIKQDQILYKDCIIFSRKNFIDKFNEEFKKFLFDDKLPHNKKNSIQLKELLSKIQNTIFDDFIKNILDRADEWSYYAKKIWKSFDNPNEKPKDYVQFTEDRSAEMIKAQLDIIEKEKRIAEEKKKIWDLSRT
jgi:diguanylate cyclase (GGDEF)-like protein